jgi:hypothetical protein
VFTEENRNNSLFCPVRTSLLKAVLGRRRDRLVNFSKAARTVRSLLA